MDSNETNELENETINPVVDFWDERDRASVVVFTNEDRDITVAEWWDTDVYDMIEGGFFKFGDKQSVLDYCKSVGLIQ